MLAIDVDENCHNIQTLHCLQGIIMSISTISSREFTRDVAAAKRAAAVGPVFITDRGKPAFALLRMEDYQRISGQRERSLLDVMQSLERVDTQVEFPALDLKLRTPESGSENA
jgi:PHD/YefM family antitoxin component YafN of YafNO toxin-antitoxin module